MITLGARPGMLFSHPTAPKPLVPEDGWVNFSQTDAEAGVRPDACFVVNLPIACLASGCECLGDLVARSSILDAEGLARVHAAGALMGLLSHPITKLRLRSGKPAGIHPAFRDAAGRNQNCLTVSIELLPRAAPANGAVPSIVALRLWCCMYNTHYFMTRHVGLQIDCHLHHRFGAGAGAVRGTKRRRAEDQEAASVSKYDQTPDPGAAKESVTSVAKWALMLHRYAGNRPLKGGALVRQLRRTDRPGDDYRATSLLQAASAMAKDRGYTSACHVASPEATLALSAESLAAGLENIPVDAAHMSMHQYLPTTGASQAGIQFPRPALCWLFLNDGEEPLKTPFTQTLTRHIENAHARTPSLGTKYNEVPSYEALDDAESDSGSDDPGEAAA